MIRMIIFSVTEKDYEKGKQDKFFDYIGSLYVLCFGRMQPDHRQY